MKSHRFHMNIRPVFCNSAKSWNIMSVGKLWVVGADNALWETSISTQCHVIWWVFVQIATCIIITADFNMNYYDINICMLSNVTKIVHTDKVRGDSDFKLDIFMWSKTNDVIKVLWVSFTHCHILLICKVSVS